MCGIGGIYCKDPGKHSFIAQEAITFNKRRGPASWGLVSLDMILGEINEFKFFRNPDESKIIRKQREWNILAAMESDLFTRKRNASMIQTRYPTDQRRTLECMVNRSDYADQNAQPIVLESRGQNGRFDRGVICQNGNIPDLSKSWMMKQITHPLPHQANVDTRFLGEFYMQKLWEHRGDAILAARELIDTVRGTFSLIFSDGERIIAFKDRWQNRPLALGIDPHDGSKIISSETGLFNDLQIFDYIQEIGGGEILMLDKYGNPDLRRIEGIQIYDGRCQFEPTYLKSHTSIHGTRSVDHIRWEWGSEVAKYYHESVKQLDRVFSMPRSGDSYFNGFAHAAAQINPSAKNLTGIWKTDQTRYFLIARDGENRAINTGGHKYGAQRVDIEGYHIGVTEDSILRSDTSVQAFLTFKLFGAKEVHIYSAWPPVIEPCDKGVDFPTMEELIMYPLVKEGHVSRENSDWSYDLNTVNSIVSTLVQNNARKQWESGRYMGIPWRSILPDPGFEDLYIHYSPLEVLRKANVLGKGGCTKCITGIELPGYGAIPADEHRDP